jgi:transcriptional regulator CtsR
MSKISDIIEAFILEQLDDTEYINLSRNELANFFNCAPSQINYVLETRFTMERGFVKESRRGGGGYIRISKVPINEDTYVNSLILESIGEELTEKRANQILDKLENENIFSKKERKIISSAICESALQMPFSFKDKLRANIFKNILMYILKDKGE